MDYFEGTVENYLRADRKLFLNSEYLLQLDPDRNSPPKSRHWYVDVLAIDFRDKKIWLCEVTYSATQAALLKRLLAWQNNWDEVQKAVRREIPLGNDFELKPWVFIPEEQHRGFQNRLQKLGGTLDLRLSSLEQVLPWKYRTWDRCGYETKS